MSNRKYKKKYYIGLDSFGNKLYHADLVELKQYWLDDKTYTSLIYWTGPLHGAMVQNTRLGYAHNKQEYLQVREFYYKGAYIKKIKSFKDVSDEEIEKYTNKFQTLDFY